jgi:hypothetical protein
LPCGLSGALTKSKPCFAASPANQSALPSEDSQSINNIGMSAYRIALDSARVVTSFVLQLIMTARSRSPRIWASAFTNDVLRLFFSIVIILLGGQHHLSEVEW